MEVFGVICVPFFQSAAIHLLPHGVTSVFTRQTS